MTTDNKNKYQTLGQSKERAKLTILIYVMICTILTLIGYYNMLKHAEKYIDITDIQIIGNQNQIETTTFFILQIIIVTAIMIIIFKLMHIRLIALLFELGMIFVPVTIFFVAMLLPFFDPDDILLVLIAGTLGLLGFIIKQIVPNSKDVITIICASGISIAILISFQPEAIIAIAIIMLAYDIISVFVTKHMVFFAKNIITYNLPLTITAYGDSAEFETATKQPKQIPINDINKMQKNKNEITINKQARIDLGSGDLIMFSVMSIINFLYYGLPGFLLSILLGIIAIYYMLKFVIQKRIIFPALVAIIPTMLIVNFVMYILTMIIKT